MIKLRNYFIASVIILNLHVFVTKTLAQTCSLSINTDATKKIPMFVNRSDGRTILVTNNTDGILILQRGESLYLTCPGNANEVIGYNSKMVLASCGAETLFFINGNSHPVPIDKIECLEYPQSYTSLIGTCANNRGTLLEIGFELSNTQNPQIQVCFDIEYKNTYWVKVLVPQQNPAACSDNNIEYDKIYYGTINPDNRYDKQSTIRNYADNIVKNQLISSCEYLDAARKRMTYYYINTVPLWKSLQNGNWQNLENLIKKQSVLKQTEFHTYIGMHEVFQLNNKNITLDSSGKMPIPMFLWKVIIENTTGKGVAFVAVNDVFQVYPTICTDFCHHITWLGTFQQSRKNLRDGIIYCCTLDDLEKVPNILLPEFTEWNGEFLY